MIAAGTILGSFHLSNGSPWEGWLTDRQTEASAMSKRAGGGNAVVTRGLCVSYFRVSRPEHFFELQIWPFGQSWSLVQLAKKIKPVHRINGCEVMAIQSFACFHIRFLLHISGAVAHLLLAQTPTHGNFDIPAGMGPKSCWLRQSLHMHIASDVRPRISQILHNCFGFNME